MLLTVGIISSTNKYRFPGKGVTPIDPLTAITFPTVSGTFVESPSGRWGSGTGYGLSALTLPASTSGWIQSEYQGSGYIDVVLGVDTVNNLENYLGFDGGIAVSSSFSNNYIVVVSGSITNTGVASVAGDLMRINRVGSTITGEYYRGGVWTVFHTFSPYSGVLYIKADIAVAGNYLLNPKGSGIS